MKPETFMETFVHQDLGAMVKAAINHAFDYNVFYVFGFMLVTLTGLVFMRFGMKIIPEDIKRIMRNLPEEMRWKI